MVFGIKAAMSFGNTMSIGNKLADDGQSFRIIKINNEKEDTNYEL